MHKVFAIFAFLLVLLCVALGGIVRADPRLDALDHGALIVSQDFPDAGVLDAGTGPLPNASPSFEDPLPNLEGNLPCASQALVDAAKTGSLIAVVGALITLLVSLLRSPHTGALVQLIPARWRVFVPLALGILAGAFGYVSTGLSFSEALMVAFFAGPTAVFGHETVNEAVRGQRTSRAKTVEG